MFGVYADNLVGAELEGDDGGLCRQLQDNSHASFAEDVDLTGAELRVLGADCDERLHWIVGYLGDLRVDSVAVDLRSG